MHLENMEDTHTSLLIMKINITSTSADIAINAGDRLNADIVPSALYNCG
jgi:hypothetical protein